MTSTGTGTGTGTAGPRLEPIVRLSDVSFWYGDPDSTPAVIADANLTIEEGSFALVLGRTGAGKSTLLQLINGLVPRFSGGTLAGRVHAVGRDTRTTAPRELAGLVGYCPQDAADAFVTDKVETELAWSLEQLGVDQDAMWRRVDATASLLGLGHLLDRPITTLSMGERQRLAIGAALTAEPQLLLLDEPTSMLDPLAAEEVLAALDRLVSDLGLTVVIAEHRLDRVLQFCDIAIAVDKEGAVSVVPPADATTVAGIDTPMTTLARRLRWDHVPTSTRSARKLAQPTRVEMGEAGWQPPTSADPSFDVVLTASQIWVQRGARFAVNGVDLDVRSGEILAITGRNGAGKSTLLSTLAGAEPPARGLVRIAGVDPYQLKGRELIAKVGWLPPSPIDLMTETRVVDELDANDEDGRLPSGTTANALSRMGVNLPADQHPRDLSAGQTLALALAILLAHRPQVVLLDEPTVGLDYTAKAGLMSWLRELTAQGVGVVLATHDVDVVAEIADRMMTLASGSTLSIGPSRPALLASRWTAPAVSRVFAPLPVVRPRDIPAVEADGDRGAL